MSQESISSSDDTIWFWRTVGPEVERMFTREQKDAIESVVKKSSAKSLPTDIRLSYGKYFFRIIAGKERRNPERIKEEAELFPFFCKKNMPILVVLWVAAMSTLYALVEFGIYALTGISFNSG